VQTAAKDSEVLDGVRFRLVLPREAISVPVMRRVLGGTLLGFGADEECVADILLAATEACTNVIRHGDRSDEYQVSASVDGDACQLEIANGLECGVRRGRRRDRRPSAWAQPGWARARRAHPGHLAAAAGGAKQSPAEQPATGRASTASASTAAEGTQIRESGRGLTIMRACVDDLTMRGTPAQGTVVSMRKRITWAPPVNGRHADGPDVARSAAALREAG
jgi:anti-sigma regulatory factor (Ser/Thr protein kinase)